MSVENKDCRHCGAEILAFSYVEATRKRLLKEQSCFTCDLWIKLAAAHFSPHTRVVRDMDSGRRIHDTITAPMPAGTLSREKGYGGARFVVTFEDGTVRESDNVWCQGIIPERFYELFPVNATITHA